MVPSQAAKPGGNGYVRRRVLHLKQASRHGEWKEGLNRSESSCRLNPKGSCMEFRYSDGETDFVGFLARPLRPQRRQSGRQRRLEINDQRGKVLRVFRLDAVLEPVVQAQSKVQLEQLFLNRGAQFRVNLVCPLILENVVRLFLRQPGVSYYYEYWQI